MADPNAPAMLRSGEPIPAGVCGNLDDVVAMTVSQAADIESDADLSRGACESACRQLGGTCRALINLSLNCENLYLKKARDVDASFCQDASAPGACRNAVGRLASSSRRAKADRQHARQACDQAIADHCGCGG
jgi:hypothetical protein